MFSTSFTLIKQLNCPCSEQSLRMAADSMPGSGGTPFDRILDVSPDHAVPYGARVPRSIRGCVLGGDTERERES